MPVALEGNVPQPDPKYFVGFAHRRINAGSATWPLDVIAGISPDGKHLRIAVVNATFKPQPLAIEIRGLRMRGAGTRWLLTGASLDAANKVGAAPGVTIAEASVPALGRAVTVPATSAAIYEFPIVK